MPFIFKEQMPMLKESLTSSFLGKVFNFFTYFTSFNRSLRAYINGKGTLQAFLKSYQSSPMLRKLFLRLTKKNQLNMIGGKSQFENAVEAIKRLQENPKIKSDPATEHEKDNHILNFVEKMNEPLVAVWLLGADLELTTIINIAKFRYPDVFFNKFSDLLDDPFTCDPNDESSLFVVTKQFNMYTQLLSPEALHGSSPNFAVNSHLFSLSSSPVNLSFC